jgi:hypothetical protein
MSGMQCANIEDVKKQIGILIGGWPFHKVEVRETTKEPDGMLRRSVLIRLKDEDVERYKLEGVDYIHEAGFSGHGSYVGITTSGLEYQASYVFRWW